MLNPRITLFTLIGLAAVVGAYAFSPYLRASLVGPDVSSRYTPFVRHLIDSGKHCYDNGTTFCEDKLRATKEFTIGYLFQGKLTDRSLPTAKVYGCFDESQHLYKVWSGSKKAEKCSGGKLRKTFYFGNVAQTPSFEAPVELHRCFSASYNNYLVTDDTNECEQAGFTDAIDSLGYAASAGHLPTRRTNLLCDYIEENYGPHCNVAGACGWEACVEFN